MEDRSLMSYILPSALLPPYFLPLPSFYMEVLNVFIILEEAANIKEFA